VSESVDILIKAEDMATPVVAKSAKSVDALDESIKRIKASGEQAKKSTEFFGTIANVLGGSEIGSFASQIAGVTEKTSQFAEVQKLGGAGAFAFKAGLVAAVGAIAFQVGNALGNMIFQTERWTKKLEEATNKAKELAAEVLTIEVGKFADDKEDIELIRDPEGKKAAYKDLLTSLSENVKAVENRLVTARKKTKEWDDAWQITGDRKAFAEQAKADVLEDEKRLKTLKDQALEIRKLTNGRAEENKALAEKNALQDKSDEYLKGLREEVQLLQASKEEQAAILAARNAYGVGAVLEAQDLLLEKERIALEAEAAKQREADNQKAIQEQESIAKASASYVQSLRDQLALLKATDDQKAAIQAGQKAVGGDVGVAAELLKEIELIKTVTNFEKMAQEERNRIQTEEETAAKRLADLKQSELDKLEEERILLTKGAEAAQAFRLVKEGLAEADALDIAKQQAELERIKEANKPGKVVKEQATTNQAFESRLLRSGPSDDAAKMTAQNTAIAAAALKRLEMIADREEKERTRQKGRITNFLVVN
jgi:hypothetical protein